MNNYYILTLADIQADLETVGGKGMSLARMLRAGLPVPGGFHVTTEAYRCFVKENGIQQQIVQALQAADADDPATLEPVAQTIAQLFLQAQIPAEIETAITQAYAGMQDAPVAVRSSATAEDLPGASFAGQQETYLNIRGVDALLEAVKKCWASLWTARAIAYRLKNDIDQATVALAVVVQELVFAEAAGILFTANPVNGKRSQTLINAAWGLGEAVVSGAVTPDTLTMDKLTGKVLQRETARKLVMTVRTASGTHEQPVPDALQKKAVLTNRQAADLTELGAVIEAYYGDPMDIEWVFASGKFFILQARPITAMPPDWEMPEKKAVYARGSLAEHTPGPVTPLFATLGLKLANQATTLMWQRMLGKNSTSMLVGDGFYLTINDYVYGGFRMDAKSMVMITWWSLAQVPVVFRNSVERWQAARDQFASVVDDWEQKAVESFTPSELLIGACTVFYAACRYFTDIQACLPAASSSEVMFSQFYNRLIKREQDPTPAVFLIGFETTALRAEKSLFDLAQWLKTHPNLAAYVQDTPAETLLEDMKSNNAPTAVALGQWQEWTARFQQHLEQFGRTSYEFDFANPTVYEAPAPLLEVIKSFLKDQAGSPYDRQQKTVARREEATRTVLNRIGWPVKGLFKKLLLWAQETNPMREDSIAGMGMGHPLVRRMLGELGKRFAAAGAMDYADDIYWLEESEVETLVNALEKGQPLPRFAERVPERKEKWRTALKLNAPVMLPEKNTWSKLVHGDEVQQKDGKMVLKGIGTSSGVVTAPARVLFGPEDFGKMQPGDVLVAVTTTPAWTPLFTLASAVVTDIGGPLSHSSIVAREYGIPAVMAARSATRIIQDGQMVTVNGGTGTVTI